LRKPFHRKQAHGGLAAKELEPVGSSILRWEDKANKPKQSQVCSSWKKSAGGLACFWHWICEHDCHA